MKSWKILAVVMAVLLCFTACGAPKEASVPEATPAPTATPFPTDQPEPPLVDEITIPRPESGIPDASTIQEPSKDGEFYQTRIAYIGMADSNLMVGFESSAEGGLVEQSYQISSNIDLDALGIQDGDVIDLTYIVDANGIKRIQSVSKVLAE